MENLIKDFDYRLDDIQNFMKEELERIIQLDAFINANNSLSDSRALAIWYLHQETGIDYQEAKSFVLDDKYDNGVDLIWIDKINNEVLIGQVEYEGKNWGSGKINKEKASYTFNKFQKYLYDWKLPDDLPDASIHLWRSAYRYIKENKFKKRFIFISPKLTSDKLIKEIRTQSKINDLEFFDNTLLLQRAHEFIDGQSGLSNFTFNLGKKKNSIKIKLENGTVYIFEISIKELYRIVSEHRNEHRLKSLFASNVRSYLNKGALSKEIGHEIRKTIELEPSNFFMYNNGITIQTKKAIPNKDKFHLERASISNGCQTSMNILKFFDENPKKNPSATILVTVIQLDKYSSKIVSEIARYRNFQNEVNQRDLRSNDPLLVTLHHRMLADNIDGSSKKYYLQRKRGEKQSVLQEESSAKGKYEWIDVEDLAKCIVAVLRQNPELSSKGTNELFGKYYSEIFPNINEPSYKYCKFAYWLSHIINSSYNPKDKWKAIGKDSNINQQKDFKKPAKWFTAAFLFRVLDRYYDIQSNYNFIENFVRKCERMKFSKKKTDLKEFQKITQDAIENCFLYLHSIAKANLNKELRKNVIYNTYDGLFKGPNYELFKKALETNTNSGKRKRMVRSIEKFIQFVSSN